MAGKRDRTLVILLMSDAALKTVAASAVLAEIVTRPVVSAFGLISAALSAATGVYVLWSRSPAWEEQNPR